MSTATRLRAVGVLTAACLVLVPTASAAAPDAIRVGGPSLPDDVKLAIVGSSRDLAGAPFTVVDAAGATIAQGTLTPAKGEPAPFARAFVADLSEVSAPGSYRVQAGGLQSRPWVVRAAGSGDLIPVLLRFFDANADGRERSKLHGPAHLNDAVVANGPAKGRRLGLVGGWMDAGDMLHFTSTTAYAALALQYAARIDLAHAGALQRQADVGVRWLVRAHPARGLFIAQVGDVRDHDLGFRKPEGDDRSPKPGIGRRLAFPSLASDVTGKTAAALALAAARAQGGRRATLLRQAREWYAAGDGHRSLKPVLAGEFYAGSAFEDDLALAGAQLFRLTRERRYLAWPRRFLQGWKPPSEGFLLTWDETGPLVAADLCGALGFDPVSDAGVRRLACQRLGEAAAASRSLAAKSAFAIPGALTWGTTATVAGAGATAAFADRVGLAEDGTALAAGARDFMLGRNPWEAGFVVGYGTNAAEHPHHWAVAIRPREPVGAVVGGPAPREQVAEQVKGGGFENVPSGPFDSPTWVYEDRTDDYVTSEPALDYVANTVLLQASLE